MKLPRIRNTKLSRFIKLAAYAGVMSGFILWDLTQAHSKLAMVYSSFFPDSDTKAAAALPATVSIVQSNDPALGQDTCGLTSEAITYTTISKMVRRAVDLAGGFRNVIKSGDTVLIKPNLVQQDSSGSGGITDVRVVKALVFLVDEIDHGKIKVIVGEGSPRPFTTFEKASGTTAAAWKQLFDVPGYQGLKTEALAAGIDFRLSNLNGNSDTDPWSELDNVAVPGGGQAQPQGGKYFVHRDVTHASVYISVPVMKIHKDVRYTGALKNQIGLAASSRYGFNKMSGVSQDGKTHKLLHMSEMSSTWHNWQDKEIVDLASIARIRFSVVDAITCLDSTKSPNYNRSDSSNLKISHRVKMNTIIAGADPVAVDNVCCRVMGLNPDDIDHITLAERVGLGTNNPVNITVVGSTIEQAKRLFRYPQPFGTTNSSSFGQSNRTWLLTGFFPASGVSNPMSQEFIPNESSVAPAAGAGGWSQPVYFIDDQILLSDYYSTLGSQAAVSYAFSYFTAPSAQQAELWVGSDEPLKIYLNGVVVYNYTGTRTFAGNEFYKEIVTINVQQGMNRLLVKSYQSTGKYTFSLNICEVQANTLYKGNRIPGLKFTTAGTATAVHATGESVPTSFALHDCFPNPFNPATTISYELPAKGRVTLRVYDLQGRAVTNLVEAEQSAGYHSLTWNASDLSSGVYFARLTAGGFVQTRRMLLMK
ncbi:MAG: DUF362 domain-containing protein [Ignavibacteriales bacterium]|nr:DUF362 domain-containing protein [Ignavibacteriales bacterium]